MENLIDLSNENNQVTKDQKPPPRECPRCNSDNTSFCYYNNYCVSQPRYHCKDCRRYWTHGGIQRNIPIGGSSRKSKRARIDLPSQVPQVLSVDFQQVNHHQPFLHFQENNEFLGSFAGSSSAAGLMNRFGSLPDIHGGVNLITNVTPIRSYRPPMGRLDLFDGSFQQHYYDVGSNDLFGNPFINQSVAGYVDNYNGFGINQEDHNKWNQSFNNIMNMNHNASTSGSRGSSSTEMNKNKDKIINSCVFSSSYHLEKHGP